MSPNSLIIFLILAQDLCADAFHNSILLTPTNRGSESSGIQLSIPLQSNVQILANDSTFHINPTTQANTDLQFKLTSSWGFHPAVPSTLELKIDGFTPNATLEDGEFLMLFAVDNVQYFSIVIRLESNTAWLSYPAYQNQPLGFDTDIQSNIIAPDSPSRWERLSNNDNFDQIGSPWYKDALNWPLHIQITNDPIQNLMHYKCIGQERPLGATFTTSFQTDRGMTIYLMNDANDGKPFDIYSIEVNYTFVTESPTYIPTDAPTLPSMSPTLNPTTLIPTQSPHTPFPTIVVKPSATTAPTAKPTMDAGYIERNQTSTTSNGESFERSDDNQRDTSTTSGQWILYLVIVIIVLLCCLVLICVAFGIIYRKKQTTISKTDSYERPMYTQPVRTSSQVHMNDDDGDRDGFRASLNMVSSVSNNIAHSSNMFSHSSHNYKHHSIPTVDEDFNEALGNFQAEDAAMIDDLHEQMATRGSAHDANDDDDDNEYDEEQQILKYNQQRENAEGALEPNVNRQYSQFSHIEGEGGTIDVAQDQSSRSSDEQDEFVQNRTNLMKSLRTADGGDLIIEDELETMK